jgi:hypothetical protein
MTIRALGKLTAVSALLILAVLAVLFLRRGKVPPLRAAAVPVHARIRHSQDPTAEFPEAFPLQVAVLLTAPQEGLLGLTHSLREMGIPFFVTRDLDRALAHRLVVLYPAVDAKTFTDQQVQALTRHVEEGGSVFAQNVFASTLRALFGFNGYQASRKRYHVVFTGSSSPLLKYFDRPEEKEIWLGKESYPEIFWTNGYAADPAASVLARFEDGSAALLEKHAGRGSAYLVAAGFKDLVLRNQVNRDYDAERKYVNAFEPGADVWLLLLRAWYESASTDAVRLATIPDGMRSVLLLSHDVDWEDAVTRTADFAQMESRHHVTSTFFIQTKFVSDANSRAFFFGANLDFLRRLRVDGFSLGSHSIIQPASSTNSRSAAEVKRLPPIAPRWVQTIAPRGPSSVKSASAKSCSTGKSPISTPTSSAPAICAFPSGCPRRWRAAAMLSIPRSPPRTCLPIFPTRCRSMRASSKTAGSTSFR